jgi:hypothetical protein
MLCSRHTAGSPKRIFCTYTAMMSAAPHSWPRASAWPSSGRNRLEQQRYRVNGSRLRGCRRVRMPPTPSGMPSKGRIVLVHLYPREMSIYGDLGNTRCLAARIRRHGYDCVVHDHHPGMPFPPDAHLLMGGGGQDSGQPRVEDDLAVIGDRLRGLAADGTPMVMICGMYQMFGHAFITQRGPRAAGAGHPRRHHPRPVDPDDRRHRPGHRPGARSSASRTILAQRFSAQANNPSACVGSATATTARTTPRALAPTTSSGPTCTGRSCRPTPPSRTRSSPPRPSGPPVGRSSPSEIDDSVADEARTRQLPLLPSVSSAQLLPSVSSLNRRRRHRRRGCLVGRWGRRSVRCPRRG